MKKTLAIVILCLTITTLFNVSNAQAHILAKGIIKERMDTMTAMGKSLGTIVDMIKGKTSFDAVIATQAASEIHDHSLVIRDQYPDTPESKAGEYSQALSNIWSDRTGFEKLLDLLELETEKLAQVTASNNPKLVRPQFAEVIEICSACHEKYRKPKS